MSDMMSCNVIGDSKEDERVDLDLEAGVGSSGGYERIWRLCSFHHSVVTENGYSEEWKGIVWSFKLEIQW